jgi:hypothetical protein
MAQGDKPDPMGKRALFWAPAQRHEGGSPGAGGATAGADLGKRALYSAPGSRGTPRTPRSRTALPGSLRRRSTGDSAQAGSDPFTSGSRPATRSAAGFPGLVEVECSSCRQRSEVSLPEYCRLHFPLWMWRPGRGFAHFMMCPSCRRRTWVSVSWEPWHRLLSRESRP